MFLSGQELRLVWGIKPKTVLHVGAHTGEEVSVYTKLKASKTVWIEAQPDLAAKLAAKFKKDPKQDVICAAVWSTNNESMEFHVTSNSESSSLLDLKLHSDLYPEIREVNSIQLRTQTLDSIIFANTVVDFMNIDIQGAELEALRGATRILGSARWVYLEVNEVELYENCPLLDEIDSFMDGKDFVRVSKRMWLDHGWGDALYIKNYETGTLGLTNRLWRFIFDIKWHVNMILRRIVLILKALN